MPTPSLELQDGEISSLVGGDPTDEATPTGKGNADSPESAGFPPSSEAPPTPEKPEGKINVTVEGLPLLHQLATELAQQEAGHSMEYVSKTFINDGFLDMSIVSLIGIDRKQTGTLNDKFNLFSEVFYNSDYVNKPPYGYFSEHEQEEFLHTFAKNGYEVTPDPHYSQGITVFHVQRNGVIMSIRLTYYSREDEERFILGQSAAEAEKGHTDGYYTKTRVPKIAEGLKSSNVFFCLSGNTTDETYNHPDLFDLADFTHQSEEFAEGYKLFLEEVYRVKGVARLDLDIRIRPPVLNLDSLAEVKSQTGSEYTATATEQMRREVTDFEDIAGQDTAVAQAKRLVLEINHPEVLARRGVKRPKGILFYGPPGTGKTMIARAVATEANAAFFNVKTSDVGAKWYGESERLVQEVFDRAKKSAAAGRKAIVFFDELDALAPSRTEAHEATRKVVATLLQNLDGFEDNPNVTVIAASNLPKDIDPALRRAGRFDKFIEVGLPTAGGREAILAVHINKARERASESSTLFAEDLDLSQMAQATEGMSGADLANLINLVLEEKAMHELETGAWVPVSTEDLNTYARVLGKTKEEKRRLGFELPPQKNGI